MVDMVPRPCARWKCLLPAAGLYPIEVAWFNGNWTNDAGDHGGANIDLTMDGESIADRSSSLWWSTSCFAGGAQVRGPLRG